MTQLGIFLVSIFLTRVWSGIKIIWGLYSNLQGSLICDILGSSIAKDLIDSQDLKYTLFGCEIAFETVYLNYSFEGYLIQLA